jgi:hypothetical protein
MNSQKYIAVVLLFCLNISQALSQSKIKHAEDAIGKIKNSSPEIFFKRVDAVKNIDKVKAASLKKTLAKELNILFSQPVFNPPKGFVVKTGFGINNDPSQKNVLIPECDFAFNFYYLVQDGNGGIKESMDGTVLGIETNTISHFFEQVGNFWEDCSNAKVPEFFEQPPISDSTADYIELDFSKYGYPAIAPNRPFRIIKRNPRPLFVPLTRKEFVEFLIAKRKYEISEDEKEIAYNIKSLKEPEETLKNPPSYLTQETIAALKAGMQNIQKANETLKHQIADKAEKIREFQNLASSMSSTDAASPARLDYNKGKALDAIEGLVRVGRMEGAGLYKINPGYYDTSPAAPAAQLIFVYYQIPNLSIFEKTSYNYLEQKTINLFNQLDYHKLKESME